MLLNYVGITHVCAMTGYSKSRIYKLVEAKKMPVHRPIPNGKLLFLEEEIRNWVSGNVEPIKKAGSHE